MIFGFLTALTLLQTAELAQTAAVFVIEPDDVLYERIEHITDWSLALERTVIDRTAILKRLTSMTDPQLVLPEELQKKLMDADDREARYNVASASEVRQEVLAAYDNSIIPTPELRSLAAQALQATAASSLYDGKKQAAMDAAKTVLRRFPDIPLDTRRYPPIVEALFKRAAVEVKHLQTTDVTFVVNRPANVFADGILIGKDIQRFTRKLPQGSYVVSAKEGNCTSLAHFVVVASKPVTVEIDIDTEAKLEWNQFQTLRCGADCETSLRHVAQLLNVTQAVGLRMPEKRQRPANGLFVNADSMTSETKPIVALADLQPPVPYWASAAQQSHFSPWSLVPFGVGQFAQHRYIAGGIYCGIETGLLAWHVAALARHSSQANEATAAETSVRHQRNLSGALLVGSLVANVVEALIVDALSH